MTFYTYQTKNSTSYIYPTRSTTTLAYKVKVGSGWEYNQATFAYNQDKDDYNSNVYYNSVGYPTTYTYQSKS